MVSSTPLQCSPVRQTAGGAVPHYYRATKSGSEGGLGGWMGQQIIAIPLFVSCFKLTVDVVFKSMTDRSLNHVLLLNHDNEAPLWRQIRLKMVTNV